MSGETPGIFLSWSSSVAPLRAVEAFGATGATSAEAEAARARVEMSCILPARVSDVVARTFERREGRATNA